MSPPVLLKQRCQVSDIIAWQMLKQALEGVGHLDTIHICLVPAQFGKALAVKAAVSQYLVTYPRPLEE